MTALYALREQALVKDLVSFGGAQLTTVGRDDGFYAIETIATNC